MSLPDFWSIKVAWKRLPHAQGFPAPTRATPGSAGHDLQAAIEGSFLLEPGQRQLIPAGFCMALPVGYEAQIRSRSGLALKHGISVLNSPATIDADYRGEIKVLLMNHGKEPFAIERGMRMAQMVVAPFVQCAFHEVNSLEETGRGASGFGSTGLQ